MGSERAEWRRPVQPGGFSVVDRGSGDYRVFQALHDLPCSFLCRVKEHTAYEVQEEPGWWVVYVDTPAGQLSWHVGIRDIGLFLDAPAVI